MKYLARGQGPKPDAVLIWPASPKLTKALPRWRASSRASASAIQGSVSLPIRIEGTGRRRISKLPAKANFAGLAGATNSTPATSAARSPRSSAWAAARQPKLCAASTKGPRSRASVSRTALAQRARCGASQSSCSMRSVRAN